MKTIFRKFLPEGPLSSVEEAAVHKAEPQSTDEFALVRDLGDLELTEAASAPTLQAGESQIWKDTGTDKYYFIYSPNGTKYLGVELGEFTP